MASDVALDAGTQRSSPFLNKIGLHENASDPCLFTGSIHNPSNSVDSQLSSPLTLGLYVNDFIYFYEDTEIEQKIKTLLLLLVTVKFRGTVEWFLGTHFQWLATDNVVSLYLSQTGLAAYLVKDNNIYTRNITPDATLYCLGLPINAIPELDKPDDSPWIDWLACSEH
jgi:hypothetical protein